MKTSPSSEVALTDSRIVTDDRTTIEYFTSGTGPVVVLLPPLAGQVEEFRALAGSLNGAGYRTIAIHQTGVGRSRRPFRPRPTLANFATDVARVLTAAGAPREEPVFLVGRGLGNRIARMFAQSYPERVLGLILIAAGGQVRPTGFGRQMIRYLLLQLPFLPVSVRRKLLEPILCTQKNVLPDFACRRPPLRAVMQQGGAARRTAPASWWSGGNAPMLVIQGEDDRVAPAENAQQLQRELPDRVQLVTIPGAGHAVTFDAPDVLSREVLSFLDSRRSSQ